MMSCVVEKTNDFCLSKIVTGEREEMMLDGERKEAPVAGATTSNVFKERKLDKVRCMLRQEEEKDNK